MINPFFFHTPYKFTLFCRCLHSFNLFMEPAKIRPLYPRGQRPLYPTRCRVFGSNVINTGLIQPFGPAPVGSTSKKTLIFHCGRCETLPTPAFWRKAVIAGVGKVLQRPQWKIKVFFDFDPTGAGPKGGMSPVFMKFELKTRQRVG